MQRQLLAALAVTTALAASACSTTTRDSEAGPPQQDTATQIEMLRKDGICLLETDNTTYSIKAIYDFWIIDINSSSTNNSSSVAISDYPDVETKIDIDKLRYRSNLKRDKTLTLENGDLLVVSENDRRPFIHVFSGTAEARKAALKLVTFCKP